MRTTTTMRHMSTLAALLLAGTATGAHAQFSGDPASGGGDATSAGAPAREQGRSEKRAERRRTQRTVDASPYLEIDQVLTADLKNGGDVLTYTNLAVGVDAAIVTNRAELAGSVRYEHRIGWNDNLGDSDVVSGLLRGRIEAARSRPAPAPTGRVPPAGCSSVTPAMSRIFTRFMPDRPSRGASAGSTSGRAIVSVTPRSKSMSPRSCRRERSRRIFSTARPTMSPGPASGRGRVTCRSGGKCRADMSARMRASSTSATRANSPALT